MEKSLRIIISGGGTGGHIFPAVSIANAIRERLPKVEILFVGAEGRMEMQRVPAAGYRIIGLPIAGFDRKNPFKNISVLFKLFKSQQKARQIIKQFMPDVAVGVGGYASGPTLNMAGKYGIPTLLQEQNSYAGVTNKLLAKRAKRICVAYDKMDRFFEKGKIILTGNPIRQSLLSSAISQEEGLKFFNLATNRRTLLVIGGSLGARTINESILAGAESICQGEVQVIWQTGKYYYSSILNSLSETEDSCKPCCNDKLYVTDFISSMEHAYAAADLVISRAGAGSISEFCILGKPVILVPSPNVAEDHQTKNALALVEKGAAVLIKDSEAAESLLPAALKLVTDETQLASLSSQIQSLAKPHAASTIADEVIKLATQYRKSHENE